MPEIAALLRDLEKNQHAIDALVEKYVCHKRVEEGEVDSRGETTKKSVKDFEVFYLGGEELERWVKIEGKELSAAEQQKENDRVAKRIQELEKRQAKKAQQPGQGTESKEGEVTVETFLRAMRFTNPRREHSAATT